MAGNGCQIVDGGYKYMEIGNGKIVWLSILLRLPDVTSLTLDNILTVPQVIASGTRYQFYAGPSDQGMIEGSKIGLGDTKGNTGHKWKSDGYFLSVIYAI